MKAGHYDSFNPFRKPAAQLPPVEEPPPDHGPTPDPPPVEQPPPIDDIGLGRGVPTIFDTAGGRVEGRVVPGATVQIGNIRVEGIRVGINNGGPAALLGQNFLNKVDLRQSAQRMTVQMPDSP